MVNLPRLTTQILDDLDDLSDLLQQSSVEPSVIALVLSVQDKALQMDEAAAMIALAVRRGANAPRMRQLRTSSNRPTPQ